MKKIITQVNHFNNPIGYVLEPLTISWTANFTNLQSRIIISKNEEMKDLIYDTGFTDLNSFGTKIDLPLEPYYIKGFMNYTFEEFLDDHVVRLNFSNTDTYLDQIKQLLEN